jgi:hypothetical protein
MGVDAIDETFRLADVPVRSEEPVPDGKDIAVVGVRQRPPVVVMYLVHVRGDEDPGQRIVQSFWEGDIRMVELRKKGRQRLIEKDQPDRRAGNDHGNEREQRPKDTFPRMMPVGGGGVHPGVAMMNEVKFPEPFYLVMNPVDKPGADKVEHQQAD